MTQTTQTLPVSEIHPNPDQPRKHFDAVALDELATSLRTYGLIEPIIVRPDATGFEIIAGERRWRAAQLAGLVELPVIVRVENDADAFELSMIENVVRADMNPIEEAVGYQRLVDSGLDVATIASRIGKAQSTITNRIKLLKLADPLQALVASGQLDAWSAGHLTKLSHEGQHQVVQARANGLGVLDVARMATAIFERESQTTAFGDDWMTQPIPMPEPKPRRDVVAAAIAAVERIRESDIDETSAAQLLALASSLQKASRRNAVRKLAAR